MDKIRIEQKAVNAIREVFDNVSGVLSALQENDRGPCVDGKLRIYESEKLTKDNLLGEIDVQIKGTESKAKSSDHTKYKVSIADLRKFKEVYQGVLYFVVHVGTTNESKIFYKAYLPYELNDVLGRCSEGQKTVTERFKALPRDDCALYRLCVDFIANRSRQMTDNLIGFSSLQGWEERGEVFERFVLPKRVMTPADFIDLASWNSGSYLYGVTKSGVYHLIEKVESVDRVEMGKEEIVHAGDYSDAYMLMRGQDAGGRYMRFGGFEIRLDGELKVSFSFKGDFEAQLKDAQLVREVVAHGSLLVDGILRLDGIEFCDFTVDEIDTRIGVLRKFMRLLDELAVKVSLEPGELTSFEVNQLDKLAISIMEGKSVPLSASEDALVNLNMDFKKGRIKVIALRADDGNYRLCDPLNLGHVCMLRTESNDMEDEVAPLPTFFILDLDDFVNAMNLDADRLDQALEEVPIVEGNSAPVCNKLLQMIAAYDNGAVCSDDLLKCCLLVAEKLVSLDRESEVYFINHAQVLSRMGSITPEVTDRLQDVAMSSESMASRAAAFALLDSEEMAAKCLDAMSEEERCMFESWPIANLMGQAKQKKALEERPKKQIEILQRLDQWECFG